MSIKICVEGGGGQGRVNTLCRKGFSEYFAKICPDGRKPKILPCGSRRSAYEDFCISLRTERDKYDLILLLVDSEDAVADGNSSWEHVRRRTGDNWVRPAGANDENLHLMVQCMESWFLADKESLATYFGRGFRSSSLPGQTNIELIAKNDVFNALEHAVRQTAKQHYRKTDHGFEILGLIDPTLVSAASQRARILNDLIAHQ